MALNSGNMKENEKKKSNLYYTRDIPPKRVTNGGNHLRGLAPGQHSSEETSQRWRAVGNSVSKWTTSRIKPMTYSADNNVLIA